MAEGNSDPEQFDISNTSELDSPRWAVLSFERCEAAGLTYSQASEKMAELDGRKIAGLCVVSQEAAARLTA